MLHLLASALIFVLPIVPSSHVEDAVLMDISSVAQNQDIAPNRIFSLADRSGDGALDLKELQFSFMDEAHRAHVSAPRAVKRGIVLADQVVAMRDADGDGRISKSEAAGLFR